MPDHDIEDVARGLLGKLLRAGEKQSAGVSTRRPALTAAALKPYHDLRSLAEKEDFEAVLKAARAASAVTLTWPPDAGERGFVQRVDLIDTNKLAACLGIDTLASKLSKAEALLGGFLEQFPVLGEILAAWGRLANVRGLSPDDALDFADAARTIQHMQDTRDSRPIDQPIREVSARLFRDSKRIERLTGPLTVLLSGDLQPERREPTEVWREIGLFREEQPVRLAGDMVVACSRVTTRLDAPYAAFSADSIRGLETVPTQVLTIENLTTFHSEARRRFDDRVLLIYTGGMPSPAWRSMYRRLLGSVTLGTPVTHWGDIDEGGFRIAAVLAQDARAVGHVLQPWRMHPNDVPIEQRKPASEATFARVRRHAELAGWTDLGLEIVRAGFVAEQESWTG
jgi:hypothetical protein